MPFERSEKQCVVRQVIMSSKHEHFYLNPITSGMAQEWFEQKFGTSLKIQPPNSVPLLASSSTDSIDANYINVVYSIVPIWSESQIAAYMQVSILKYNFSYCKLFVTILFKGIYKK